MLDGLYKSKSSKKIPCPERGVRVRVSLGVQKNKKDMKEEEVTLQEKFKTWEVRRKINGKVEITTEVTQPMTPQQALKHFNAYGVQAIIE